MSYLTENQIYFNKNIQKINEILKKIKVILPLNKFIYPKSSSKIKKLFVFKENNESIVENSIFDKEIMYIHSFN